MKLGKGDVEDGKKWWRGLYYSAFFQENLFLIIFLLSPFNMRMMMMMMEAEINWLALACSLRTTLSPVFFLHTLPFHVCLYFTSMSATLYVRTCRTPGVRKSNSAHCGYCNNREHYSLAVYLLCYSVYVLFVIMCSILRCSDLVVVLCRLLSRRGHCHVIHDDFASSAGQQLYLFVNLWKLPFQVILYPPYPCFLLFNLQMPLCVC